MNLDKLKTAETAFLSAYPLGFDTPGLKEMVKKHDMSRITLFAQNAFSPTALEDIEKATDDLVRLIARSSIVSVFEKAKLRDAVRSMSYGEREDMMGFVRELLHGHEAMGFDGLCGMLFRYGASKWPLVTALRCYYYPDTDLVIKPTTVKNVISHFGLIELHYVTQPNFAFYNKYRSAVQSLRSHTAAPMNSYALAGYSGFLMMVLGLLPNLPPAPPQI